jgi:hypothetical protein
MTSGSGKWFAILVIVLFLMSTFSVLLYTNSSSDSDDSNKSIIIGPTTNMAINYSAKLDGNIIEVPVQSSYRLMTYTNETDVDKLDLSIRDLNNVYNVAGSLTLNKDNNTVVANYIYIADIVGTDLKYDVLLSALNNNSNFMSGQLNLFPYAKVQYNSLVTFENKDLNKTIQYDLGGNEIIVLVEPETYVNDKISFAINAQFKGNTLGGYGAYQLQNLSASPVAINSIYKAKFNNELFAISFDGNIPLDAFKDLNENNLDYNYDFSYDTTYLTIDKNAKFDNYLSLLNGISNDYNAKQTNVAYGTIFVDTINYMDKKYDLNKLVNTDLEYNITAYLVRDKIVSVNANPILDVNN